MYYSNSDGLYQLLFKHKLASQVGGPNEGTYREPIGREEEDDGEEESGTRPTPFPKPSRLPRIDGSRPVPPHLHLAPVIGRVNIGAFTKCRQP